MRYTRRQPKRIPRELEHALQSVRGASEAWTWTPADIRQLYVEYVGEAWLAPKRRYRANRTAKWAASGQLQAKARFAIGRGGPEALD